MHMVEQIIPKLDCLVLITGLIEQKINAYLWSQDWCFEWDSTGESGYEKRIEIFGICH